MRHTLASDIKKDIAEGMAVDDPFSLIWSSLCWENIIVPIFFLNGENLEGRFKVLTNAAKKAFHFVIFDSKTNTLYDPTYEKYPDAQLLAPESPCAGTGCTIPMLGSDYCWFDLNFYLRDFEIQDEELFNSQLREYGGRFLVAASRAGHYDEPV